MTVAQFVEEMRAAAKMRDPAQITARLRFPALDLFRSNDWDKPEYYAADPEAGFGIHYLHEEADHTLLLCVASLLPGRALDAHDHCTWALTVGLSGTETNVFWRRSDDGTRAGYAELEEIERGAYGPGSFLGFRPADIHSVINESAETTLTLNAYGIGFGYTGAHRFDPVARTIGPLIPAPLSLDR
jgi:predicted metal-dependent enzyme (double-stranded beta helix superfamily)